MKLSKIGVSEYLDLTQHEIHALTKEYNLADAHTHQSQSSSQRKIVERLPQLWYESEKIKQKELEEDFIEAFFDFHKQPTAKRTPSLLVYASSIAMAIFSNYFKKKNLSVGLITPCFDNLYDLLKHNNIKLQPVEESWLHNPNKIYENLKKYIKTDVIFLVSPNNPTGFELMGEDKENKIRYLEIIRYAKEYNKILAFDFCFYSFVLPDSGIKMFDVYELLEKSGVSYISVEDTGKTWPLQDAKIALIKTSKDLHKDIYNIHTAYLLNTSPFILNFVTEYIKDSIKDNCKSIYSLLNTNRNLAREIMKGSILEFQEPKSAVSVTWFKIKNTKIKSTELQKYILKKKQVYVLPGTYFFWNNRESGEHFIRIALARDAKIFKPAIKLGIGTGLTKL
ncbi:aspartate/tyrosine/aromatic aminotransferase [Candidatus Pacearchaeota archaeon CG10_big_fil_rev_8_21_14_0_10_31_24]|nr:MAG: aspartate/tyrosine/aromatic aminotransferase [Candidatus Pacearchaeota archaeon CG10_big_fil_rev_8_21_14_0_10_31_24]